MRGSGKYIVAVREQGQFVGEMSSFATITQRCASVRAKGFVRAALIPCDMFAEYMDLVPEVRTDCHCNCTGPC